MRARNEGRRKGRISPPIRWGARFIPQRSSDVRRVQIWQGGDPEWAISVRPPNRPPERLCFSERLEECISFFELHRTSARIAVQEGTGFVQRRRRARLPRLVGYYDFSKLRYISTAAAVVLTAEYERLAKLHREVPPTVELDRWTDDVFRKLYQLGFFEIVGHVPQRPAVLAANEATMTMQIVSMKNADDLALVDRSLQQLGEFLNPSRRIPEKVIIDLLTGLSEAISNVTHHAYTDDYDDALPHIGSLWISATADRNENSLTVVAYDQGVTIPFTYPRIARAERVGRFLARALRRQSEHPYVNDGTYIRAAMKYGGSRTDQKHRGRGLPQMMDVLSETGAGKMTVYSRGGWCRRDANGRLTSGAVSSSIGGTLIEWTLEFKRLQQVGER